MTLPALLDWRDLQLGSDPDLLRRELEHTIRRTIGAHPRSQQATIGPSELGGPCLRRIGHKLAGTPTVNRGIAWRPTVGTAVHSWLADAFEADNRARVDALGNPPADARWAVETSVTVGDIGGKPCKGTADLYDRVTATVVDWKIVGRSTLMKARTGGPSGVYRTQLHLYGRGFRNARLPVERVAIAYLPSSGELHEAHFWAETYQETVAAQALSRADGVAQALAAAGPDVVLPALSTAENYCSQCPYFRARSTDLARTCPGASAQNR